MKEGGLVVELVRFGEIGEISGVFGVHFLLTADVCVWVVRQSEGGWSGGGIGEIW